MSDINLEKNQNGSTVFVKIGINLWLNVRDSWEIHLWYICHFKRNNIITQWHPVLVDGLDSRIVLMIWSNLKMVKYQIPNIAFLPPFSYGRIRDGASHYTYDVPYLKERRTFWAIDWLLYSVILRALFENFALKILLYCVANIVHVAWLLEAAPDIEGNIGSSACGT